MDSPGDSSDTDDNYSPSDSSPSDSDAGSYPANSDLTTPAGAPGEGGEGHRKRKSYKGRKRDMLSKGQKVARVRAVAAGFILCCFEQSDPVQSITIPWSV